MDERSTRIYESMDKGVMPSDLILLLLSVSPAEDKKKMYMLVFLAWKEIFKDIAFDPVFSSRLENGNEVIDDSLTTLKDRNYINISNKENKDHSFSITEDGRLKISSKFPELVKLRKLSRKKAKWDKLSSEELYSHIEQKYPKYRSITRNPERDNLLARVGTYIEFYQKKAFVFKWQFILCQFAVLVMGVAIVLTNIYDFPDKSIWLSLLGGSIAILEGIVLFERPYDRFIHVKSKLFKLQKEYYLFRNDETQPPHVLIDNIRATIQDEKMIAFLGKWHE